jgi:iron complex transport system ATP-binding protein
MADPATSSRGPETSSDGLEVRELGVVLGGRSIVRAVSFAADRGTVTAVLGPNGAGKTTLLKALVGLLPYSGQILVDGRDLAAGSRRQRRQRARLVAYVPQRSALDAPLRVETVVGHGRYAHTSAAVLQGEDLRAVRAAMAATDIADLAGRSYLELSGGEQRRVLIARALATGARILLLDEPTESLDVGHALALFGLLRDLATSGVCVIAVLHDLNDALAFTDRALLLDHGAVAAAGPTADILTDEPIRRVYGVEPVFEPRLCFRLLDS